MSAIRVGDVVVLPRSHSIVDVFTGIGWKNVNTFAYSRGRFFQKVGNTLTKEQMDIVAKAMRTR